MSSETEAQETLKKKTVPLLRAVLAAKAKDGIPMHMLCCEFEEQTFGPLKFKDMGYGSLEQYLRDCPETCSVSRAREGYLVVKGVASEDDAHVFKLVSGQRKDKRKKPKRFSGVTVKRRAAHFTGGKKPNFRPPVNNYSPSTPQRFFGSILGTPPTITSSYKKLRDSPSTKFINELAPRFQRTKKGNGFVGKVQSQVNNHLLSKPKNQNFNNIVVNENKDLQMTIFQNSSDSRTKKTTHFSASQPSNKSYEAPGGRSKTNLSAEALSALEKKLRGLLKTKINGLWATRLQPEFKSLYGETLPDDIKEIIQEKFLSFIKIESPMPNQEIMYYKDSPNQEATQIPPEIKETPERKVEFVRDSNDMNTPLQRPNRSVHSNTGSNKKTPLSIEINQLPNGTVPHVPVVNGSILHDKDTNLASTSPMSAVQSIIPQNKKLASPRNNLFKIPSPNLPDIGNEIKVFVCHVESLDRFFVQFSDSTIADLVHAMQPYYEDPNLSKDIDKPRLDEYCCARYSKDKVWCRAKILSVKEQKNMVNVSYCCRVIFVDYGNDEYVISTELKYLTDEFVKLPSQAVQCCLHNLYPMREGSTWSEKVTEHFRKVTDGVELTMCVKQKNGSFLSVDLVDANGQSVSAYFCTSRIARMSTSSFDDSASSELSSHNASPRTPPSPTKVSNSSEAGLPEYVSVPEDRDYIDISVSHINSTSDIVIVMIGAEFNEKLDKLEEKMSKYYDKESLRAAKLEVNGYYAVLYDGYWVRVKLLSINDYEMEVFLLDHGNKTTVTRDEIKVLHSQFYKLPFQAISCSLANVPENFDAEILQYLTDNTIKKDLIGYIVERPTGLGMKMSIELYDTTNDSDDININNEIIAKIENEQNLSPKFPEDGGHCNAYIAHISSTGDAFIQILGPGTARLEILMEDMTSHFTQTRASEIVQRPEVGTICCAKFYDDGAWYRAKVTKVMQKERKVEVEFIDYGNREVIQMLFIRNPDAVNKQVLSLPPQAVKCRIADYSELNLTEDTYKKMREFAQSLDNVYVNVVEYKDNIPIISILVPSETDEEPMDFIDKYQYIQSELEKQARQGIKNLDITDESSVFDETCSMSGTQNTSYEDISVTSEGSFCTINPLPSNSSSSAALLSEYDVINNVPGVRDFNNDKNRSESPAITFSAAWGIPRWGIIERVIEGVIQDSHDPWKFCFVPYSQWDELETMHVEMMKHYEHSISDNVTFSVGDVCAAYHAKHEIWYRAVIVAEIEDQVVVKYPDFSGTVEIESAKNIRPLHASFKKLPFLAVRCTLTGIEPVGGAKTWDAQTATFFNEMVMNETFQIEVIEGFCSSDYSRPLEVNLHGATEDGKPFVVNEKLISLGLGRRVRVR